MKPILSFLSALVLAEKTSLGSSVASGTVQFSGFDYSSTAPPVDSLFGSNQHREAEIVALSEALEQVHALQSSVENKAEVVACLYSMIQFLRVMEDKKEGADLRLECARVRTAKLECFLIHSALTAFVLTIVSLSLYRLCHLSGHRSDS